MHFSCTILEVDGSVLGEMKGKEVFVYIDDILVATET